MYLNMGNNMSYQVYSENPSIEMAMINTKKGVRAIFSKDSETSISVSHGDDMKSVALDFSRKCVIDKDKFIKLYIHSFPVLSDLKNSTKLFFQYILTSLSNETNQDRLYIAYKDYQEKAKRNPIFPSISQPTFSRCLRELLDLGILFKSTLPNLYFVNIAYVFNGDRLRFLTEYQLKKDKDEAEQIEAEHDGDLEEGDSFHTRQLVAII